MTTTTTATATATTAGEISDIVLDIYILDMNEKGFYLILVGKTSFGRIMIIDIRLA